MNKVIYAIGYGALLANTVMMFVTFMVAYLNDFSVVIYINNYGEAHAEFILLLITTPIAITAAIMGLKHENKRLNNGDDSS